MGSSLFRRFAGLGVGALGLAGCDGLHLPQPTVTPVEQETILSRTSSLSNVYILDKNTGFVTCAEPPPDTAFDHIDDSDLSLSLVRFGGDDRAGGSEGSEEAEMLGRTPGVLIARELFFRACEFSRNYDLEKEEALALYRDTLNAVREGWAIEGKNTTVKIDESETYNVTQTIPGVVTGAHRVEGSTHSGSPATGSATTTATTGRSTSPGTPPSRPSTSPPSSTTSSTTTSSSSSTYRSPWSR